MSRWDQQAYLPLPRTRHAANRLSHLTRRRKLLPTATGNALVASPRRCQRYAVLSQHRAAKPTLLPGGPNRGYPASMIFPKSGTITLPDRDACIMNIGAREISCVGSGLPKINNVLSNELPVFCLPETSNVGAQ